MTQAPVARRPSPDSPAGRRQSTVELVFDRMAATYGSRFADMWAGIDPAKIKAVWNDALSPFDHPTLLRAFRVLEQENPLPPTLPAFVAICKAQVRPLDVAHRLTERPAPMPDHIRDRLAAFRRKHVVGGR